MMLSEDAKLVTAEIAPLLHKECYRDAAEIVNDCFELGLKIDSEDPKLTLPPLQQWLHYLLDGGGMAEAASMLWTPNIFSAGSQYTKDIWSWFDNTSQGLLMGSSSTSKSYSTGVRLYLEWIRDPDFTSVNVVGPSEDHLEKNLFSGLVSLHDKASLPQPGTVGALFIGKNRRDQLGSIKGVVIPVGKVKKAARLQGTKRKPRPEIHPVFGALSRMYVFLDEFENVPAGIWQDIENVLSQVDEDGGHGGFKILGAYNPTNQQDEVGKRAEPEKGWEAFDIEKDFRWKSKRGWDVLRLDGEKSENVVQDKTVFPGLQTRRGLEALARNSGGKQSAGYYSMGRGAYPPQGIELTIIPPGLLSKMRGEFIWHTDPHDVGSADLALEGGASTLVTLGKFGLASGMKLPPSLLHTKGHTVMFKTGNGQIRPRYGLQADQQFALPKGDTTATAAALIDIFKKAGVRPEWVALDRTGHGAGIADMIRNDWSPAIHDVNYSEGATDGRLMLEDTKICKEAFERMFSELWFGLKYWAEFGYFLVHPSMETWGKLTQQLTQRKFRSQNGRSKVESKKEYLDRGFQSPDEADSLTLFVYAGRMGCGQTLSMKGDSSGSEVQGEEDDEWYNAGGVVIDASNRTDSLGDSIL
jgi:hypothetical protein